MTNFTMRWAALSLAVVGLGVAGCTTEADVNADGGGTGGTGGSTAGTGGTGGSTAGTGGTGGSTAEAGPDVKAEASPEAATEAEAGLSCTPDSTATNCEKCALSKCCAEANACEADVANCYAPLDDAGGNPLDNY